ncbi:MAG: CBS domain-containing protein [Candidatus Aenigmatarchaeota archaeon]
MKAKDIMSTQIIFANLDESLYEISKKLSSHNISGLPILDEQGKIVGIISQTDIIKFLEKFGEEKLKELKAKDIIKRRKKLVVAKPTTSLKALLKLMIKYDVSRIPIVDENRKVIGIVSKSDIIKLLATHFEKEHKETQKEERITTTLDKILSVLEVKDNIDLNSLAKELGEDENFLEKYLRILEKYGLVELGYTFGKVIVKKKK